MSQEKKIREKKKPTLLHAVIPLLGLLVCLGGGYAYLKLPTQVCLLAAAAVAAVVAWSLGLSWDDMVAGMTEKVTASFGSIMVMICVGAMISSWMFSGTIPMMIYYGIKLIDPRFLFVTGFLVCAIISTFTGTSFGSAGTAGVAVMGVAIATGAPLPITAGAVISGAVFGDKLSPFSDTTMLAPIAAGCDIYESYQAYVLYHRLCNDSVADRLRRCGLHPARFLDQQPRAGFPDARYTGVNVPF